MSENAPLKQSVSFNYPKSIWVLAFVVFVAFLCLLTFLYINRYHMFRDDINQLMDVSAIAAAHEIETTLKELRRSVSIFTAEHAELLAKIHKNINTEVLKILELTNLLEKRVPNMFTYTISNEDSSKLLDNSNLHIGDSCKIDIQNFILNTYKQVIRLHPHPSGHHFDIMVPFVAYNNEVLVFIVSFLPNAINRILNNYA
ncbi:MAG: hypothetical protein P8X88_09495, partial [Gammaproteobacteria bacterium]